jgi:ADP-ribose pyrophosphatase YjhB (NUDIX family)
VLSVGACTAVFDGEGRILLVRKAYGERTWTLPGGGLDGAESPIEAAERETLEETGLEVAAGRLIAVYHRVPRGRLIFFFEATVQGGVVLADPGPEIDTRAYFPPSRLPAEVSPLTRLRVNDACLRQERTVVRIIRV